jgi:Rieske 2Fe-2S family protein
VTAVAGQPSASPQDDLAALVARRRRGFSLESAFYASDEVFTADLRAIFSNQWIFVASVAELPDAGDFLTINIGSSSVIVIRDDEEQVRALHNVCRHRGARILDAEHGSVGNLVCGYHRWTYGTDGTLRHAAATGAGFDKSCFSLKPVAHQVISGLIFICLADEPSQDLASVATLVSPYVDPHQLHRTRVGAQIDLVEEGNWKLVMENNRECYHCDGHPELAHSMFPTYGYAAEDMPVNLKPAYERYLLAEADLEARCEQLGLPYRPIEQLDTRVAGFRVQREALDGKGESFTDSGAAISRKLLADFAEPRLGRLSLHLQPNAWFHFLSDHAVTFAVLPRSPGRTLVRTTWLVHEDAREGVDYDVDELTRVWRETNAQDAAFVARTQLGASSSAYQPGPYMPSEYQVDAFCSWYVDRLTEHLNA